MAQVSGLSRHASRRARRDRRSGAARCSHSPGDHEACPRDLENGDQMSEPLDLRASDSDRGRIVERLREHSIEGRLTLEEFTERMAATYLARTSGELEELTRDLPSPRASVTSRRRPTRFLFSIFGSTGRKRRIRMPAGELPKFGLSRRPTKNFGNSAKRRRRIRRQSTPSSIEMSRPSRGRAKTSRSRWTASPRRQWKRSSS